ncbi:MAG: DUF4982 domain-containing protein [Dysgonamonadaceae bacterium]|jgi:beta-galactosidase/beta-glucuronidase|nr:DUF4982 domain-containing protein [Dysgonamonadaceae bacterium]
MKKRFLILLFTALWMTETSSYAQVSFGKPEKINDRWQFQLGDDAHASASDYDASQWRTLDLPHDWSIEGVLSPYWASCTGYLPGGIGWYRKNIHIPAAKEGEKIFLYFEGVYNRSEVFLNGQALGNRPNGYISFLLDATPYIQFGKENILAVRVDHSQNADSRWYTGSGIYRNVWLIYAQPTRIAPWGVFVRPEKVTENNAQLAADVEIINESANNQTIIVRNELISPEGKVVVTNVQKSVIAAGQNYTFTTKLNVKHPQLWNLEHPNLYALKTTVSQNGQIIDETTTTTGIRSFTFDPDTGFALNGNRMKLKGVCIHHDAGVLGSAVPRDVWKRRLQTLKEIGVNAIRTSHNPQASDLYDLCDEEGILVLNEAYDEWEFPKNKWINGWNVGTPGHQGSFDIFEKWSEQDLADMVRRDRNHVSVFAWSIGNEVDYPNDPYSHPILDGDNQGFSQKMYGGYKKNAPDAQRLGGIAKRLVAVVKQYDTSRPVTAGLAGVAMSNETEYPGALDIAGYNYTESSYLSDHQKYPNRIIYGSENRHDMSAWKAVRDNDFIFAQFLWTGIDYLGESGVWPSRGFYSGLLDFGGFIKPRGYFRKALWSDQPFIYIGTYPTHNRERKPSMDAWPVWNYLPGATVRVVCYTNCASARLLLNGKEVGKPLSYNDETGIIYWDVPYGEGQLEAVGYDDNRETCRYAIQTSGRPYAITASIDKQALKKEKDLAHVTLQIVDEKGLLVQLADDEITCTIEGPAQLLGLEASNNSDMGDYRDNRQRAFMGRLLAYIQTTGQAGEIRLKFTAPWLKATEIKLQAE